MDRISTILLNIKEQINELENDKTKEVLNSFHEVIDLLSLKIDEITDRQNTVEENIQYIDEDLTSLQDEVFEEISFEELEDIEDEYVEVKCTSCNNPLFVEQEVFDSKSEIPCPFCKGTIKF